MSDSNSPQDQFKIASDAEQKFEYFFVSLIVALLGLSIQTAKPEFSVTNYFIEIFGWFLLLLAAALGFLRVRWIPSHHQSILKKFEQEKHEEWEEEAKKKMRGYLQPFDELEPRPLGLNLIYLIFLEKEVSYKIYKSAGLIQLLLFLLGVTTIFISRALFLALKSGIM